MLVELKIENFAIIQKLELTPTTGLVVVTGETGAGKSIILDAISVLVGGKVDAGMVRSGTEKAVLEATFVFPEIKKAEIIALLEQESLDVDDYLVLSREIKKDGRSSARVNGSSVSVNFLRQIGGFLIDIHGQSEHLSLLNTKSHLTLLDTYCNNENNLSAYRLKYDELLNVRKKLSNALSQDKDAARLTDLYSYQLNEISAARIQEGELQQLTRERDRLANAESLASNTQLAIECLDESSNEEVLPAVDLLVKMETALTAISKMDSSMRPLAERAKNLVQEAEDLGRELHNYADQIEYNPKRLEFLEDRCDLLKNLFRKYGQDEQTVLTFAQNLQEKLDSITNSAEEIEKLTLMEKNLRQELAVLAQKLTERRQQAAQTMCAAIEKELSDLSMAGARFEVSFRTKPDEQGLPISTGEQLAFAANGWDQVEFLISPNRGEGFAPLAKIASGGETSRLMLALKNVLAQADPVPTLIFDEIDQGIGGRVGVVVGEKLWRLGKEHQVFCVTHLPQLAAFSNQHYHVQKIAVGDRTTTKVTALTDEGRIEELALMMGNPNETNRQAARELIEMVRQHA